MRQVLTSLVLFTTLGVTGDAFSQGPAPDPAPRLRRIPGAVIEPRDLKAWQPPPIRRDCPTEPAPRTVEIREADPDVNEEHHNLMRRRLIESVKVPNTTVLLGPNVVLDFSTATLDELTLRFGRCVTLKSVDSFPPDRVTADVDRVGPVMRDRGETPERTPPGQPWARRLPPGFRIPDAVIGQPAGPARTPRSRGPLLKYGPHRLNPVDPNDPFAPLRKRTGVFLLVGCSADSGPGDLGDHVRISGFRIHGPSFGQQSVEDIGIRIFRCLDVEVSNMEIAGWGGNGIEVLDDPQQGPGQEPPNNRPGDRIGRPEQVRIFGNYIHHNQHPREGLLEGHAAGYGVSVHHGAWAQVHQNVFDSNRHAIAAAGDTGGYEAYWNLVLKGGGYHYAGFYTHQFDIHGSGDNGFGGQAGIQFWFAHNAFQYLRGPAIKIRGRPRVGVYIHDNVFAHEGLEDDWGDDAIHVHSRNDLDVIKLGPNNAIDFDSYGRYGVCDFDGDGVDDLFLATGQTWWYSSFGEFQWTYLTARTERLNQVRLGYFDDDLRCDVLTENGREWVIASGGTSPWQSIGAFGAPLSEVAFGQFDPARRDHRPGVTRRTTHAFRRLGNGQWQVTSLSAPGWRNVQSSSFPMKALRFGDFTGDGVTDVLAVNGGRWAISESATGSWRNLNPHLSDNVGPLLIADLNHNNIDDIIRLEAKSAGTGLRVTWWVSDDGRSKWRRLKSYDMPITKLYGFAGRFGVAPGGGVLLIGHDRFGNFYSEAEIASGASPEWRSLFAY